MLVQVCPQVTLALSLGVSCPSESGGSSGGLQTTVVPSAEAVGQAGRREHWASSTPSSQTHGLCHLARNLRHQLGKWVVQMVKNLPAMWETQVQSLGREDPLEKGMAAHSSVLAWRILEQRSLAGYSP